MLMCSHACCLRPAPAARSPTLPLAAPHPQVEDFYVSGGYLLPNFHREYWMGASTMAWPNFTWTDITMPPMARGYRHWGTLIPLGVKEPFMVRCWGRGRGRGCCGPGQGWAG
jgi:hypothetical protein